MIVYNKLKKFQNGNVLYVDPSTPTGRARMQSYNDSLNLYKAYEFQKANFRPGYEKWLEEMGATFPGGKEALRKARELNTGKPLAKQLLNKENKKTSYKPNTPDSDYDPLLLEEKPIIDYYKSLIGNNKNYRIGMHSSPDLWHKNIKSIGEYYDGGWSPIYKKPVQTVEFKQPSATENKQTTGVGTTQTVTKKFDSKILEKQAPEKENTKQPASFGVLQKDTGVVEKPQPVKNTGEKIIQAPNMPNVSIVYYQGKPTYYQNLAGERVAYGSKFEKEWQYKKI